MSLTHPLKRITCALLNHTWKNDTKYPTHGRDDIPYPDSYCGRCGKVPATPKASEDVVLSSYGDIYK